MTSNLTISELGARVQHRIDFLVAEIEMLRGVGCAEEGDGRCGACIKCARSETEALRVENSRLKGDLNLAKRNLAALHNDLPNTFHRELNERADALLSELRTFLRLAINPQMSDRENSRTLIEFNRLYDARGDERMKLYDEFLKLNIDHDILERVTKAETNPDRMAFARMMINRLRGDK